MLDFGRSTQKTRGEKTMNITHTAMVLTLSMFLLRIPAAAQSCQQVKATFVDVFNGGLTSSGTITQGGLLNGTTLTVYTPGGNPTPAPTVVSFIAELTITTSQGQLKASNVYLYDFATGQGTAIGHIKPNTSTGKFAGATGVLFLNETSTTGSSIP